MIAHQWQDVQSQPPSALHSDPDPNPNPSPNPHQVAQYRKLNAELYTIAAQSSLQRSLQ